MINTYIYNGATWYEFVTEAITIVCNSLAGLLEQLPQEIKQYCLTYLN